MTWQFDLENRQP